MLVMTLFVYLMLPETKGIPIEEMGKVWKAHPYWSKFVGDDDAHLANGLELGNAVV